MKFDDTLIYQFAQLSTAQRVSLDKALQPIGLFGGQIFVLMALWDSDGLSQAELADRLNVSAPAINKMVKSLTDADLVVPRKSDADARITQVFLTDLGKQTKENAVAIWLSAEERFTEALSKGEATLLFELILKIRAGMQPLGDEYE